MNAKPTLTRRGFLAGMAGAAAGAGLSCRSLAAPGRARRDRPNIVFVFTDQQQRTAMSAANNPCLHTPAMDSVAHAGVLFTRCLCSTPQCSASRASIVTGRYPHSAGVITNTGAIGSRNLDPAMPSVGRVFGDAGYETAYFGKWHLGKSPLDHGFGIFDHGGRGKGDRVANAAVEFLNRRHDRPFIMFASFINPHDVYAFKSIQKKIARGKRRIVLPRSRIDDLTTKPPCQAQFRDEDQGVATRGFGDAQWRDYLDVYYYLTEKVDRQVGRILDALRARGLERETIVVFTSDHGDLASAHGMPFKGPAMYRELVEIPLAIRWPGEIPTGQTSDALVSNVDLLPTLCDLAGVTAPEGLEGLSLRPLLAGRRPQSWRRFAVVEYHSKQRWANPIRMIQTKDWKYVTYARWGEELYDLEHDPDEIQNLAGEMADRDDFRGVRDRLSALLDDWMRKTGDNFADLQPTDRKGRPLAEA
jgi:choline-sulfatase/glucosamine-6-phosphate deaminase